MSDNEERAAACDAAIIRLKVEFDRCSEEWIAAKLRGKVWVHLYRYPNFDAARFLRWFLCTPARKQRWLVFKPITMTTKRIRFVGNIKRWASSSD